MEAVAPRDFGIAERHRAHAERRETIIRAFMETPDLSLSAAQARFQSSRKYLVELPPIARQRLKTMRTARGRVVPSSQDPT